MNYLRWYRVIDVAVDNEVEVTGIEGGREAVALDLKSAAGERRLAARRVVLATGRDGLGGPFVPVALQKSRPALLGAWQRCHRFRRPPRQTVGVIGAGASAADNAAEALEAGALRVAMLTRCADMPRSNRGSIAQHIADRAIPPSRESMLRCSRHANFSIIAR